MCYYAPGLQALAFVIKKRFDCKGHVSQQRQASLLDNATSPLQRCCRPAQLLAWEVEKRKEFTTVHSDPRWYLAYYSP